VFVDDFIVFEVNKCMLMNRTFESGWDLYFTLWEQLGWHVCKMWKHGACLEIVQQDANVSKCGDLNQHDIIKHMKWNEQLRQNVL
jgi:hypothetical protein